MPSAIKDELSQALCHIVSPVGMLGYGLDAKLTDIALQELAATGVPTALILDSGSTDSGPQKLALGGMTVPRSSYVRDLRKLLKSAFRFNVPLIFSSAGGSGTDEVTRELIQVIEELAAEIKMGPDTVRVVAIFSDIDKDLIKERLRVGAITGCGSCVPPLVASDIDECPHIVAQMGPEPFIDALVANRDLHVLIGGRAYDPAPYVAFAEYCYQNLPSESQTDKNHRFGTFTHMGKIMECAGLCAVPKGGGATATIYLDGSFHITPMAPEAQCTPLSVAAHTLYEKSRPDHLYGPGGYLDLTSAEYEALSDGRTVKVRGSTFSWSTDGEKGVYQVKLEGAKATGYRAMYIGAHVDPILLSQMDEFLDSIRRHVEEQHDNVPADSWELDWHVYGRDESGNLAAQICLIGEARAATQELATSIAATAKVANIHGAYRGQKATSGNMSHGIGGVYTVPLGRCAEFCVYHLMDLKPGEERVACIEPEKKTAAQGKDVCATLSTKLPENPTLGDIAKVIRSKNSGPYEITFDIMFDRPDVFRAVKRAKILSPAAVAGLFGIAPEQVVWSGFFDQAQAYKATIPRIRGGKPVASGGLMEDDVHGSQMYMPLLRLRLPGHLAQEIRAIWT
ncbi:hypothetical protein GQ53DRAFT_877383 [Thozetella sp. PMI_491]|nr:hypothetical protein GQ53DRAFT_877383 [Thozetella sp. PMI_491]